MNPDAEATTSLARSVSSSWLTPLIVTVETELDHPSGIPARCLGVDLSLEEPRHVTFPNSRLGESSHVRGSQRPD